MRYTVIQIGARRNYAVPALLERAGMLERFYTDICAEVGLGRYLSQGKTLSWVSAKLGLGPRLQRLAGRQLPPGIARKTTTFTIPLLNHVARSPLARSDAGRFIEHNRWANAMGKAIASEGFGEATHVYSMFGECPPALVEAKRRGLRVVTEIYILPSVHEIVAEERRRFPAWEPDSPDYDKARRAAGHELTILGYTDMAICPAQAVSRDLVQHFGFPEARTAIVPYGVDPEWLEIENKPQPGRILFAGSACLRKGIHYLAMAADILSRRGLRCEFRVAGDVTAEIRNQQLCRHLIFLNRVPRHLIKREFEAADLFVLPTLAEGSAEVTYQALAAGVPVITTPEAGSVVRDGVEGRVVSSRDPEVLAEAIAELVECRAQRDQFAQAAKRTALQYIWDRYSDRLLAALRAV